MSVTISNHFVRNKVYFDVGANNGYTSVPVATRYQDTVVYAFEPTPEMIQEIECKIIGFDNYILTKKAVSNYNGKARFNVAGHSDWGCSSLLEFSEKSKTDWPGRTDFDVTREIEVDVIRLDSFIEEYGITKIDYLHIDTQGSDLKVLEGMGKYIDIVVEGGMEAAAKEDILYKGQNTQEQSIEFLENNGFEITNIQINDEYHNEVNIYFRKK
jgi:FkbM family methyltransferase